MKALLLLLVFISSLVSYKNKQVPSTYKCTLGGKITFTGSTYSCDSCYWGLSDKGKWHMKNKSIELTSANYPDKSTIDFTFRNDTILAHGKTIRYFSNSPSLIRKNNPRENGVL